MNSPAKETDDTHVYLQALLHTVRKALNECPADSLLTLHTLRGWLDVRIRYEEELKERRLTRPEKEIACPI
jgi:hypothetical protein